MVGAGSEGERVKGLKFFSPYGPKRPLQKRSEISFRSANHFLRPAPKGEKEVFGIGRKREGQG